MSFETKDRDLIDTEVTDALIGATDDGLYLGFVQVRHDDEHRLVADVYDDEGNVTATYLLNVVVGERLDS